MHVPVEMLFDGMIEAIGQGRRLDSRNAVFEVALDAAQAGTTVEILTYGVLTEALEQYCPLFQDRGLRRLVFCREWFADVPGRAGFGTSEQATWWWIGGDEPMPVLVFRRVELSLLKHHVVWTGVGDAECLWIMLEERVLDFGW